MSTSRKKILISGWRGLPHSYAVVNQFQCLELARRPDVELFFNDVPFYSAKWEAVTGLFSTEDEAVISGIASLSPDVVPDAELRIAFPYDLSCASPADKLFVFGTAEYQAVPANYVAGGASLSEAHRLNNHAHLITPSQWSRTGFIASGADPARLSVVPHGVDPAIFRPPSESERAAARQTVGAGDEDFVFLTIGAMTGNKNLPMVLEAFASILPQRPKALLVLKGSDSLYSSYEMFKSALSALSGAEMGLVLPRVKYIGRSMSFAEIAALYHAADAYVTPYSAEGFNLPALEAAACGLPVICTKGGPTDDFTTEKFALRIASTEIVAESDGLSMRSLKPEAEHLKALMDRIVDDKDFRRQAFVAGPKYVGENFTWRHAVDKLLKVMFP